MKIPHLPKLFLPAAVAVGVLAVGVTVLSLGRDASPGSASARAATAPRSTDGTIARAQAAIASDPRNAAALTALASASLDKARTTGDPTWNTRADAAARRAIAVDPRNVGALDALGTLALTRHEFREALGWSRTSLAVASTRVGPLSVRADALIELGRYAAAFETIQRRLDVRPDLPSYSRASYALELKGDRSRAIALMRRAVEAGAPGSEPQVWARVQLGLLRLGSGDTAGAEHEMRAARATRPTDARAAAGLARVLAAQGRLAGAVPLYEQAITTLPLPEYPVALAEIHQALGQPEAARNDISLARAMQRLLVANGSNVDLDVSLINADLAPTSNADVVRARRARADRPGIIGDQVLGWVLTRAGRCVEADRVATRSLRLGTRDALLFFHAGMAAACAGDRESARTRLSAALALNPAFSVRWAPVARHELRRLS